MEDTLTKMLRLHTWISKVEDKLAEAACSVNEIVGRAEVDDEEEEALTVAYDAAYSAMMVVSDLRLKVEGKLEAARKRQPPKFGARCE